MIDGFAIAEESYKHGYNDGYRDGLKDSNNKRNNGSEELEKCPFCGEEVEVFSQYSSVYDCIFGYIKCPKCRVTLQSDLTIDMSCVADNISVVATKAHHDVKKDVIKKWNRRVYR